MAVLLHCAILDESPKPVRVGITQGLPLGKKVAGPILATASSGSRGLSCLSLEKPQLHLRSCCAGGLSVESLVTCSGRHPGRPGVEEREDR